MIQFQQQLAILEYNISLFEIGILVLSLLLKTHLYLLNFIVLEQLIHFSRLDYLIIYFFDLIFELKSFYFIVTLCYY